MKRLERWLAETKSFAFLALHATPSPAPTLTWAEAMAWAAEQNGRLPSRRDLQPQWFWSTKPEGSQ